jgi:hypothetical protein
LKTRSRLAGIFPCLVLLLLMQLGLPRHPALAAMALLEDLHYRLEVLVWQDAARVKLTLKRLGPDRFAAEIVAEPQGLFKILSGGRRERLETEMVWRHQRLLPLVYREESWRGRQRRFKEYRFDYAKGRLEMWESHQGKGLMKKWQTDLDGQVYDPLSAFYNIRLGLLKPNRAGETGSIPSIPYPHPEAMVVRLGTTAESGLKAMVSLSNPIFPDSRGEVFAYVDNQFVPREAWTTVSGITLRARLQPESAIMPPGLAALKGPGLTASRRPPGAGLPATAGQGAGQ